MSEYLTSPDLDVEAARRFWRDPPLSKETVYRLAKNGEIESYRLAGCRLYRRSSLVAFIERCRAAGPQFSLQVPRRRAGRPRKVKPETTSATASAAE